MTRSLLLGAGLSLLAALALAGCCSGFGAESSCIPVEDELPDGGVDAAAADAAPPDAFVRAVR